MLVIAFYNSVIKGKYSFRIWRAYKLINWSIIRNRGIIPAAGHNGEEKVTYYYDVFRDSVSKNIDKISLLNSLSIAVYLRHTWLSDLFLCVWNNCANVLPSICLRRSLETCGVGFFCWWSHPFVCIWQFVSARPSALLLRCCCLAEVMAHLQGAPRLFLRRYCWYKVMKARNAMIIIWARQ